MEKKFRVIIAGGRDFNNYELLHKEVYNILFKLNMKYGDDLVTDLKQYEIVSGHARGADSLGEKFAKECEIKLTLFPADWDKYGKSAGYRRNAEMAKYAVEGKEQGVIGILIAFWDGKSKGTRSMIDLAKRYGLDEVYVVRY